MENISDSIDLEIFNNLFNELKDQISNTMLRKVYENLTLKIRRKYKQVNKNDEQIVSEYIRSGWSPMFYDMQFISLKQDLSEKAIVIVTDDENWKQRLENLNINNMGLDNGMAGLGMALLLNCGG